LVEQRHLKILIIDDDEDIRWSLKEIFSNCKYYVTVTEASNAQDGFKAFKEVLPDLVLLDVRMPEINGIQLLKQLLKETKSTKVIMISGMDYKHILKETKFLGAKSFILKPFDRRIVMNVITEVMAKSPLFN